VPDLLQASHVAVAALVPAVWTVPEAQPVLPTQPPESGEPVAAEVAVQVQSLHVVAALAKAAASIIVPEAQAVQVWSELAW
jgi:hypothetical protein